jgi:hypothetical protein
MHAKKKDTAAAHRSMVRSSSTKGEVNKMPEENTHRQKQAHIIQ